MTDHPPLPHGTGRCRCSQCGRSFASVSAFDRHQTIAKDGAAICHDPGERGLVFNAPWWSWPPPPENAFSRVRETATRDETAAPNVHQGVLL
jgi:hypothetical protein